MKQLVFLFLIVAHFFASAQNYALVKQLKAFVPAGFAIKDTAFGDLNKDKKTDVVLIIYNLNEDDKNFDDTAMSIGRPLLVLIQQKDGKLKLAKRTDNVVMCKQCGGMMGDPFESITIKNNAFTVAFYGGSSWRWGYTYGFSWNATLQNWQLTKENHVTFQSGNPEATMKKTNIPASEISNLNMDNFNINQLGEPYETKGKIEAAKSYFHNAPNGATKRKAYVTHGDTINIIREFNTFYEATFMNKKEQITSGYLLKKEVRKIQ